MKSKMRLSPGTTWLDTDAAKAPALATWSTCRSWFRVIDHFSCAAGQESQATCSTVRCGCKQASARQALLWEHTAAHHFIGTVHQQIETPVVVPAKVNEAVRAWVHQNRVLPCRFCTDASKAPKAALSQSHV